MTLTHTTGKGETDSQTDRQAWSTLGNNSCSSALVLTANRIGLPLHYLILTTLASQTGAATHTATSWNLILRLHNELEAGMHAVGSVHS